MAKIKNNNVRDDKYPAPAMSLALPRLSVRYPASGKMMSEARVLAVRTYPISVGSPPSAMIKREKYGIAILIEKF